MIQIIQGDALERLREFPDNCVQMVITSPPYWNLRRYNAGPKEIGQEKTPLQFIANLVAVFAEVKRVLKKDGTLWVVIGDSYAGGGNGGGGSFAKDGIRCAEPGTDKNKATRPGRRGAVGDLKPKDLIGIPYMLAFALRADGWYWRSKITWCKKVPMPESVQDRPTAATEEVLLFSKSRKYFYDAAAVRNPPSDSWANDSRWKNGSTPHNEKNGYAEAKAQNPKQLHRMFDKQRGHSRKHAGFNDRWDSMRKQQQQANGSNMRNYWLLGPEPCSLNHFATFPSAIPRKAIMAGSKLGDVVLDPFAGSGTSGMVALELGRKAILIELNPDYCQMIRQRTNVTPGLQLA